MSNEDIIEGRKEIGKMCGYKFHHNIFGRPYLKNKFFKFYYPYSQLDFENDRVILNGAIQYLIAQKKTKDGFTITQQTPLETLFDEPDTMKVFEIMAKLSREYNGIKSTRK